jgi:membrane associated rhomboid family serine protease
LWPPQRGVGLREPNLGKTNPRVTLFICLRFVLRPLSRTRFLFLTLTQLVVVFIFVNFSFALFTPPLGDYQPQCLAELRQETFPAAMVWYSVAAAKELVV